MSRRRPRSARPAATSRAGLRALEAIRAEFGRGFAAQKLAWLHALAGARFGTPRELIAYHDALCFLRACPDDARVLAEVVRQLAAFGARPDVRRLRPRLADSGIAGTTIRYRFFDPTAHWLLRRHPDRLRVDWPEFESAARLAHFLPQMASFAESPALDEYDYAPRAWIERMKGPRETDAAFLIRGFRRAFPLAATREAAYDELDPPLVLEPGPGTPARGAEWLAGMPRGFQREPLSRGRPVIEQEIARPPLAVRALSPRAGERVVDMARACMVTRSRDLDAFSYGDPRDVRILDMGGGLAFAAIGVIPERRLMFESVYAFLTLRNGVPIGYVLTSALYGSAEIAYNVFETWRGAEAGRIYGRVLAMTRHLFGADHFTIFPYQLGHENEEGLNSGAWWFYQKLGFRARERAVLKLMNRELARMRRRPAHRSSLATLRRLARENVFWQPGPPRDDVIGLLPLGAIGLHVARMLGERWGSDRDRAEAECAAEATRLLGAGPARGWTAGERMAWTRWAPIVLALPGIERWSAGEKAALADVVRAKGGRRESDFVWRFDAHAKLRAAVAKLARTAVPE